MRTLTLLPVGLLAVTSVAAGQGVLHSFSGDAIGDSLGSAVSGVGDVNQDGFDDVIVGAPFDDDNGDASGSAFVRSGKDGSILYTFQGKAMGWAFGWSVDAAGDVDNDGVPDMIVGGPQHWSSPTYYGYADVLSGKTGFVLHSFVGNVNGDAFGSSVAGAGDVDKDGHADLVIGAPFHDGNGTSSGRVRVQSGKTGGVLYTFDGGSAGDELGKSVSGAGDANKDGYADVIAGAPLDDTAAYEAGRAFIWSGQTGAVLHTLNGTIFDQLGYAVSGAADVDQDGHDDVVVGVPYSDAHGSDSGGARVFSGKTGLLIHDLAFEDSASLAGVSVSGAGDVDKDGVPDIVVGVKGDDAPGLDVGSAWIYSGANGAPMFASYGQPVLTTKYGFAVSDAGDVNHDGYADVIIGDPYLLFDTGGARVLSGVCGTIVHYGESCAGSGGFPPLFAVNGCATPAGTLTLRVLNGAGGTEAFLGFGLARAEVPIGGGCHLYVSPLLPFLFGPVPLWGSGAGQGYLELPLEVPPEPAAYTVTLQVLSLDPGAPLGFTASNGVELNVE